MDTCSFIPFGMQKSILEYYLKEREINVDDIDDYIGGQNHCLLKEKEEKQVNRDDLFDSQVTSVQKSMKLCVKRCCNREINYIQYENKEKKRSLNNYEPSPIFLYDASATGKNLILSNSSKYSNYSTKDMYANTCYDSIKKVDEFYFSGFGIRPVTNNKENEIHSYIHQKKAYNNAYWNGKTLHFGDVDNRLFTGMVGEDIVAHELGHAVVDSHSDSGLSYVSQSGAINESIADIFAIIMKNSGKNISSEDINWEIGTNVLVLKDKTLAPLRRMDRPGEAFKDHLVLKDEQVSHFRDYVYVKPNKDNDYGGVHKYSGIPNHAFYNAAKNLASNNWKQISNIWFESLKSCEANDGFEIFASRTMDVAKKLYTSQIQNEIGKAWSVVGICPSIKEQKIHEMKETEKLNNFDYKNVLKYGISAFALLTLYEGTKFAYNYSKNQEDQL